MTNARNISNLSVGGDNGALKIPSGTTAQRPSNPQNGYTRFNTTIGQLETWNGSAWITGGGLLLQAVQTANFTAAAGNSYPVNTTSGAVTVTLPASPTANQQVNVFDYAGTASNTNRITINPNGGKINGVSGSAVISSVRASVTLAYIDSTQGWVDISVGNADSIPQTYSVDYLVVAGGGGGAQGNAGGGGGGGYLASSSVLSIGTAYSVTIGAGGTGASYMSNTSGANSALGSIASAIGGGYGGARSGRPGGSGGSGGGGGADVGTNANPGSGTSGQGYAGGSGTDSPYYQGGGGGGASAAGSGPNGGAGLNWQSLGNYYAGGGGGGANSYPGSGGAGGGGNGTTTGTPGAGTANTGGGGGSSNGSGGIGGNGGSGVVIIRYAGAQRGTGGTVTSSGGYTIHTFTSSGTYTA